MTPRHHHRHHAALAPRSLRLGVLLAWLGLGSLGLIACDESSPATGDCDPGALRADPAHRSHDPHPAAAPEPSPDRSASAPETKKPAREVTLPPPVREHVVAEPAPKPAAAPATAPEPAEVTEPQRFEVDGPLGVVEAALATGVDGRVPTGVSNVFPADVGKVWAWIRVKNEGAPTKVTMVWSKRGKEVFRIDLRVGKSSGWRTWSRKTIGKRGSGPWKVEVLSEGGELLRELSFEVEPAPTATAGS